MASPALMRLWRLHEIDAEMSDLRKRAAVLDPAKAIEAARAKIAAREADEAKPYRDLHAEQTDLELANQSVEDKIKRIDKEIYGGKTTGSREIANLEKDLAASKRLREKNDERLLELMDLLPPAKKKHDAWVADRDKTERAVVAAIKKAKEEGAAIQVRFAELQKLRPEAAKIIEPGLMARYDGIRKTKGTGMAQIKGGACSACGTRLPEQIIVGAKEERTVTCQGCGRLLYWTDGIV